jgi:hypothetical protein
MKYRDYIESFTPEAKVFNGSLDYGCGSKKERDYVMKCMDNGEPFYVHLNYPDGTKEIFEGNAISYFKDRTPEHEWKAGLSFSKRQQQSVPCRHRFQLESPLKIYNPFELWVA